MVLDLDTILPTSGGGLTNSTQISISYPHATFDFYLSHAKDVIDYMIIKDIKRHHYAQVVGPPTSLQPLQTVTKYITRLTSFHMKCNAHENINTE